MRSMALAVVVGMFVPWLGDAMPLPANELGRVLVLEYHRIDYPEARWTRTPEHFRADLELLYARGYRLISLNDFVAGRIAVPAGTSPVVLTFDDSSPGQFRYVPTERGLRLDPNCAVAILEDVVESHPDFGRAATFFVLPAAKRPNRLFDQPEYEAMKLQELVRRGFEIGNHTLWHADLARYDEAFVRAQVAQAQRSIQQRVPGYRIHALALPFGTYPKNPAWVVDGTVNGVTYHHDAVLMVSGGPAPSPFARDFDPIRLPRVQVTGSELRRSLDTLDRQPRDRFVSDGDPTAITIRPGTRGQLRKPLPLGLRIVERESVNGR
jgi:peptidoglycan/xylan/chitin deacetylase (PgdA/CDA1 family)